MICYWFVKILKGNGILNDQRKHLDSYTYNQFGIIQVLQGHVFRKPVTGQKPFFGVSYSNLALTCLE